MAFRAFALVAVAALACATGCQAILGIDDPPRGGGGGDGRLYYTSAMSGTTEVWSVPDLGGTPVRITDGLSRSSEERLNDPMVSWDGTRVIVGALRDADGPSDDRHLWVVDVDGANARPVARMNAGTAAYGHDWYGDSHRAVFSDDEPCSNNLVRVDVDAPASIETIFDVDGIAADPRVNPATPGDVLFWEQRCAEMGSLRRLDANTGAVRQVDGVDDELTRYRRARWSADGALIVYSAGNDLFIHDLAAETRVYSDPDAESRFFEPTFGNGATMIYAKWCSASGGCDLAAVNIATGAKTLLGVPGIVEDLRTDQVITWGPEVASIDLDGDGLANGIDPDP